MSINHESVLAMSSSPPYVSLHVSPSPSRQPLATFLTGHYDMPREPSPSRRGPIRLSSPRLFRDILSSISEPVPRRQAVLPGPASNMPEESFAGAIRRASRAVAHAEEAFHSRSGQETDNIIDLTRSPPSPRLASSEGIGRPSLQANGGAEADYFSTTTHPHDPSHTSRPRLSSSVNHPVYGSSSALPSQPPFFWAPPPPADPEDSLARARSRRAQVYQAHARGLLGNYQRVSSERDERAAIRRQRENHEAWLRTQARTRQIQVNLQQEDQSQTSPEPESPFSEPDSSSTDMTPKSELEAVDLTTVEDDEGLSDVIAKQRADAIMSQRPAGATEAGRTTFSAFKCPICMDMLRFATVTKCGHMFCHKCIIDTLKWSSNQHLEEHPGLKSHPGQCPVCRTSLAIKDIRGNGRTIVPLHMKKFTLKRKRLDKGKGKAVDSELDDHWRRKKKKSAPSHAKRRNGKASSAPRRSGTEELFGEFTNDDYATGLVQS